MRVKKPEDFLFEGLREVRLAADHLDAAASEFDKIPAHHSTESDRLIKTAREALISLKKLVDEMQNDWNCWSEDRNKELGLFCFEEMAKLRGNEAALTYGSKGAEGTAA